MKKLERLCEAVATLPSRRDLDRRHAEGWRLKAVLWEREVEAPLDGELEAEIPYGLRISPDCSRLEEDPAEKEILVSAMQLIVQDRPLSQVAVELNRQGYQTRTGSHWTPADVFDLLPRLIEVGPRIFSGGEWPERRRHFLNLR